MANNGRAGSLAAQLVALTTNGESVATDLIEWALLNHIGEA
jgi:hypothetical protein